MISGRLRKRRNEEFLLYGKKVILLAFFLIFLNILWWGVGKIKTSHYFPITSVKIYGVNHLNQAEIQQALFPLVSRGFFSTDVEVIKDKLLQSPWVSQAIVQRIWPGQVLVMIQERKPLARWNMTSLLSTTGELFNPDKSTYPSSMPQFIGLEGQQIQMLKYYLKLNKLFSALHLKMAVLELTPEQSWNVTFDNGMKLSVAHKDVLTRINHFVKVYPKIIGGRTADVAYIDLRYPNGLAVRWKTVA